MQYQIRQHTNRCCPFGRHRPCTRSRDPAPTLQLSPRPSLSRSPSPSPSPSPSRSPSPSPRPTAIPTPTPALAALALRSYQQYFDSTPPLWPFPPAVYARMPLVLKRLLCFECPQHAKGESHSQQATGERHSHWHSHSLSHSLSHADPRCSRDLTSGPDPHPSSLLCLSPPPRPAAAAPPRLPSPWPSHAPGRPVEF